MMVARRAGPPLLGRLFLRLHRLGERRQEIEADLDELFRERALERGRWYAAFRYCADAFSLWIHLPGGVFFAAAPHEGRARAGSTQGEPSTSAGRPTFDPNRNRSPLDGLRTDLKFAFRGLRRNPGFAAVAIVTLAIAIATNTTVFSVVDAVFLRPLPYDHPEHLVTLYQSVPRPGMERTQPRADAIRHWQERAGPFKDMAVAMFSAATLLGDAGPVRIETSLVSANFFEILGVDAAVGRTFRTDDTSPAAGGVAVLSHAFWMRAFGGADDVVGRTIRLNDKPVSVVGVARADFFFTDSQGNNPVLWTTGAEVPPRDAEPGERPLVVARLRPGSTLDQARAGMDAVATALVEEYPQLYRWPSGEELGIRVERLHDAIVYGAGQSLAALAAAGGILLLIAWVNVSNLMATRAVTRRREVSLRAAIGAGRARLVRQLMTENLLVSTIAGAGGVLLASWITRVFLAMAPGSNAENFVPLLERTKLDLRVLGVAGALALATSVACGIGPALRVTRPVPGVGLRAVPRPGGHGRLGRQFVLAGELALALVLLIGMGLLIASAVRLNAIPLGFEPEHVEVMTVELPLGRYAVHEDDANGGGAWSLRPEYNELVNTLVERLEALPAVEAAGAINMIPLGGAFQVLAVHIEGSERLHPAGEIDGVTVNDTPLMKTATPEYFRAMSIPLIGGRVFSPADGASAPPVAIVNQRFVDDHGLGDGALGREILVRDGIEWRPATIVGIVGNVLEFGYGLLTLESGENVYPNVYLPYRQLAPTLGRSPTRVRRQATVSVVARHRDAEAEVAASMREIWRELDRGTAMAALGSMESQITLRLADRRFYNTLIGILAVVALTLALVGVYSVMAFDVNRRTHELGVRMALGAQGRAVVAMIIGRGFRVALLGALLGVLGALATTKVLESWLYEVSPTDPFVFTALPIAMVSVGVLACWVPAQRAARVDPIASLRAE